MASNKKVSEIYVDLVARTAQFKQALNDATAETRRFTQETRKQMEEAKGSMALLSEQVGVHLPRHLRSFVAELPGVASAMSAAFNAVAVFALMDVVVKAGEKVVEFMNKSEEAAKKNQEAWGKIGNSLTTQNDELDLTKAKLENAIAKLEHKPENKLKEAIAEARVEADKLGNKIDTVVNQIQNAVKGEVSGKLSQLFLKQTGGTKTQSVMEELQLSLSNIDNGFVKGDQTQLRQEAVKDAIAALAPILKDSHDMVEELKRNGTPLDHSSNRVEYEASSNAMKNLQALLSLISNTEQVGTLQAKQGELQEHKEETTEAQKKFATMIEEMVKANDNQIRDSKRITDEVQSYGEKQLKSETEEKIKADKEQEAADKHKTEEFIANIRAQIQAQRDLIQHATDQYKAVDKSSTDRVRLGLESEGQRSQELQSAAVDEAAAKAAAYHAVSDLLFSIGKGMSPEAQKNADDAQKSEQDSQQKIADIHAKYSEMIQQNWMQMLNGINDQLVNLMTGNKTHFLDVLKSGAQGMAKKSLQRAESFGLQALGIGGKRDGSSPTNALYVESVGSGAAGVGSGIPGVRGIVGKLNDSDWASSLLGGRLFGSGSLFGGGFASGGDVIGGMPIEVGELGREQFVPYTNGRIVPNKDLGSRGPLVGHIDARGTDPVQTHMAIVRAMQATHAQAVHDAGHAMAEQARRSPR